jgi:hypothetical protein
MWLGEKLPIKVSERYLYPYYGGILSRLPEAFVQEMAVQNGKEEWDLS